MEQIKINTRGLRWNGECRCFLFPAVFALVFTMSLFSEVNGEPLPPTMKSASAAPSSRQDTGIPEVTEELLQRAVVSFGNRERLNRFFEKAERGESLTVGVLGGSITQGAACPDPAQRYHGVLLRYLQKKFPRSKFRLVNAGIGATASDYGALRAQRDLLSARPDLIVLEFGVNDNPTIEYARNYEGILRQILTEKKKPALILLFMMWNTRKNAQEFQQKLGEHYQLPLVSYRDALAPALEAGSLRWEQLSHSSAFHKK